MANADDGATIVLSGIGNELSESMLKNMYSTYGPILRIRHNGTNSAHVIFEQKKHAMNAVAATNGAAVYGKTLKVSLQRKFRKTTEPCRGFAAGICRKGDLCKYYHVTDNAMYATSAPVVATTPRIPIIKTVKRKEAKPVEPAAVVSVAEDIPPTKLCRHFSRGFCATGSTCKFAHVMGLAKDVVPTGKAAKLCQFYLNRVCDRGEACKYVHSPQVDLVPEKAITAAIATENLEMREDLIKGSAETRICIECEKPGSAVWQCGKCDNSLYCDDCNASVHQARVMAKHKRIKLASIRPKPRCGECETKTATVRCEQCDVPFCASCDACVHKFKIMQKHVRTNLSDVLELATPIEKAKKSKTLKTQDKKTVKTAKTSAVNSAPLAKTQDPVLYVESVPQLEFSSDSSDSEHEEMQPRIAPVTSEDEAEPMVKASETDSDEDFDDVKPSSSSIRPARKKESGSIDEVIDKSTASSHACVLKQKLSVVSKRSKNEVQAPNSVRVAYKKKLSSESEEESKDEAEGTGTLSKLVVKKTKKVVAKAASALKKRVVSSSDSSDSSVDEVPSAKATVKSQPACPAIIRTKTGGGISEGSSHTLVKKIEGFHDSNDQNELHLDANLNGFERLLAHDCAERLGLAHESVGIGLERHIIISRPSSKRAAVDSGHGHKSKKSKRRQ